MSYNNNRRRNPRFTTKKYTSKSRNFSRTKTIDPSKFIAKAQTLDKPAYVSQNSFSDFVVDKLLHDNLVDMGISTPSPIQDQAIEHGLEGRDIIGIADTGTGKTIAFALPILNRLIIDRSARALIIAPTRELAQQIEHECKRLASGSGLKGAVLIGGSNMSHQRRDLSQKPNVIIGTPGRIKDHIERKTLNLTNVNHIVLDEVDRMLDMGFVHDVTTILEQCSRDRQSMFFSATIDQRVENLINKFANDPITISVGAGKSAENIDQDVVRYSGSSEKIDKLHDILISQNVSKAIVFDATQRSVERLGRELVSRGFGADAIHGGKSQGQRQRALAKFKSNEISILVATDVAARGIDVSDISHVINYDIPRTYEDYVHRIGRSGRAGKSGSALTFVSH